MKRVTGTVVCLLLPLPALAQPVADRVFAQCGPITDANARLACYDAARDQNKATHWSEFSSTPLSPTTGRAPRATIRKPVVPSPGDSRMVARVTRYDVSPHGQFTVVLDNGEVWRQLASDDGAAHFRQPSGDLVQISKGFWKSYDLRLNGANTVFKVTRIR